MKKSIIIFMAIIISLTGCKSQGATNEPPEVSINIGGKQIQYAVEKNKWNGSVYDKEDIFKTILKKGIDIPSIEIGETTEIEFKNNPPEQLEIYDILLDDTGSQIYGDEMIINIPVELKDGKASFEINTHMASYLSSLYVEDKKDIRGFKMIASWGDNECEYGFIIKTGKEIDRSEISEEERKRIDLYVDVMEAAFLEENGGDSFLAVNLDTLEGLSDTAKEAVLERLKSLSANVYDIEDVKDDSAKFEMDDQKELIKSKDGTLLWIELEEYKDNKATITGVSWFGNLGAVFPKYEASFKNDKWELELISMAIS
ncbi:hypothetical protein [Paratissierella segnis]|uniref:Uncharacterized protein n=1 Tax=Paratissierella segnis TaxID=2763679 RepID=A0A926IIZ8_9FIRM|nr:hypothetical protein [Paratissierella segnis]MBC8586876.1 hypothetical protein [Paratissierella segnis]